MSTQMSYCAGHSEQGGAVLAKSVLDCRVLGLKDHTNAQTDRLCSAPGPGQGFSWRESPPQVCRCRCQWQLVLVLFSHALFTCKAYGLPLQIVNGAGHAVSFGGIFTKHWGLSHRKVLLTHLATFPKSRLALQPVNLITSIAKQQRGRCAGRHSQHSGGVFHRSRCTEQGSQRQAHNALSLRMYVMSNHTHPRLPRCWMRLLTGVAVGDSRAAGAEAVDCWLHGSVAGGARGAVETIKKRWRCWRSPAEEC